MGIPFALLVARLSRPEEPAGWLAVLTFFCCLLFFAIAASVWARHEVQRRRLVDRLMAATMEAMRVRCEKTHATRDKFAWDEPAVRRVLTDLALAAQHSAQQLEEIRGQNAPVAPRAEPCVRRAVRALEDLSDRLNEFLAQLSSSEVDAVRYGLDPFSGYLSSAESELAQCANALRRRDNSEILDEVIGMRRVSQQRS